MRFFTSDVTTRICRLLLYGVAMVTVAVSLLYLYNSPEMTRMEHWGTHRWTADPRWKDIPCKSTTTKPPFLICLYDIGKDTILSRSLVKTGSWEGPILREMGDLFQGDKLLGLIDVGANIGFYALYAAALGRKVIAIEPFEDNVVRLKKAIHLNNFTHLVTVLQNFVSDRKGVGLIQKHPNNQGDTRVRMDGVPCVGDCNKHTSTDIQVESICLDDLVNKIQSKRAIMKIDIQGYEHLAFKKASRLLDNVFVPKIFMEWVLMKGVKERYLVEEMINLLVWKNYRPYDLRGALNLNRSNIWPFDIVWKYKV